jgi:hypothetical protein
VVVVAAHGVAGVLAHPLDDRGGLQGVIDEVAQADAHVVRLGRDGLQGGPVGVDVGDEQDAHRPLTKPPDVLDGACQGRVYPR